MCWPLWSDRETSDASGTMVHTTMRTGPRARPIRPPMSALPPRPGQVDTETLDEDDGDQDDGGEEEDGDRRTEAEGGAGDRLAVGQERHGLGAVGAVGHDEHRVEDAVG